MPYRPIQHQISSQSVAKVRDIWAATGAAVEEVRQDYGEDLLVQTCLNEKMDSSRIWVQVKGVVEATDMDAPDDWASIRVRADQALRWARSADILLLVLWDVKRNRGWYSIPQLSALYLHSDLVEKDRQFIELRISARQSFTVESAQTIAWEARIGHLSKFVRSLRKLREESTDEPDQANWADDAIAEAFIDMMLNLRMIERNQEPPRRYALSEDFLRIMHDTTDEQRYPQGMDVEEFVHRMIMRSIMKWFSNVTGLGIDVQLLTDLLSLVHAIGGFREFDTNPPL